jgi:AraC-like DNA-binding protein
MTSPLGGHELLAPAEEFQDGPFSTSLVPEGESFALWARVLNKWLLNAHGRPVGGDPFRASVRLRVLPEIRFGWGAVGASAYSRTRDVTAADNDDLFLFMNLGGTFVANGRGREIALKPGEAYVLNCSELGSHASPTDGRVLTLRVRHASMRHLVRGLDDKLGAVIDADNEGLRLLSTYLRSVGETELLAGAAARQLATGHVHDLLALTLDATDGEAVREGGLRAARLRAAKALIRRSLAEPHLTAEAIAGCLNISPRSVQRLFESDSTTFYGFVTGERVAQAHAALTNPAKFGRSIADIALDCGFGDISYFNRKFKSRYGASPSEVRFHARSADGKR